MERGQADLTFNLTPQDYQALRGNPKVRFVAPYATEVDYAVMTEWGPLASPYARQALSYAFPYDAYINGVFKGYAKRAYGPIPSALLGYDPHVFHYQTDLAKARALLQKAGVKPGTTLTYDYGTNGGPAGLLLQAQLAQIGLKLKVQQLSDQAMSSIFFGTEPPSKRPNLMFQTWWPDYNDPWDMCDPLVASSSAGAAGANAGYYHNKPVDALLAQMKNAGKRDAGQRRTQAAGHHRTPGPCRHLGRRAGAGHGHGGQSEGVRPQPDRVAHVRFLRSAPLRRGWSGQRVTCRPFACRRTALRLLPAVWG